MTNLFNKQPVVKQDLEYQTLFASLQGNILKGHGRNFTTHIFLRFRKMSKENAKKWIVDFSSNELTTFKKQLKEAELYKRNKVTGDVFYNFFVTSHFYEFFEEKIHANLEDVFTQGMKSRKKELADLDSSKWEKGYRDNFHAMVLVADDDVAKMTIVAKQLIEKVEKYATITCIEYGNAIRNKNGDGLEHFGYVDGISQPLFFDDEIKEYKQSIHNNVDFDPFASLSQVLVNDPYYNGKDAFGSYFVFRKLEQNVKAFKTAEEVFATSKTNGLGLEKEEKEIAGAKLVGRFEDGTPITLTDEDGIIGSGILNNFDYQNDMKGTKCPFQGHIRATNKRDDEAKKMVMARRGIPYGKRNVDTALDPHIVQMPESGVGLLFMSFQSSIKNQFEAIQKQANNHNVFDPIIGQSEKNEKIINKYPSKWGDDSSFTPCSFGHFVTLKGGEYFFAPSVAYLKNLKIH